MIIRPHPTKEGHFQVDLGYGKNRERHSHPGPREAAEAFGLARMAARRPIPVTCLDRVSTLLEKYLESYKIDHQPEGYKAQSKCSRRLSEYFGKYLLQNITTQKIEEYKQYRIAAGVKPATVQKELCALSGLFKWAEEMNIIPDAPCKIKKFRPKTIAPPPMNVPSRDEMQAVVDNIRPDVRGLFALMMDYGLRKAEAFKLRQGDYDIERQILTVTGKGNKTRHIPIVDDKNHAELKLRSENAKEGFLWYSPRSKGPYKDLRITLQDAAKAAGVGQHVHNHLLRHGCFTDLVGVADIKTVQSLAGHGSIVTTQKYLHVRQDRLREALEKHHAKPVDR